MKSEIYNLSLILKKILLGILIPGICVFFLLKQIILIFILIICFFLFELMLFTINRRITDCLFSAIERIDDDYGKCHHEDVNAVVNCLYNKKLLNKEKCKMMNELCEKNNYKEIFLDEHEIVRIIKKYIISRKYPYAIGKIHLCEQELFFEGIVSKYKNVCKTNVKKNDDLNKKTEYQCCFCGKTIENNMVEICLFEQEKEGEQYIYAHRQCVKENIKNVPII